MIWELVYRLAVRVGLVRSPSRAVIEITAEDVAVMSDCLRVARDELARRRMRGE